MLSAWNSVIDSPGIPISDPARPSSPASPPVSDPPTYRKHQDATPSRRMPPSTLANVERATGRLIAAAPAESVLASSGALGWRGITA